MTMKLLLRLLMMALVNIFRSFITTWNLRPSIKWH